MATSYDARAVVPVTRVLVCVYAAAAFEDVVVEVGAVDDGDRVTVTRVVTVPGPVSPPDEHAASVDAATAAATAAVRTRLMPQG
ncbi:hypothetical protein GCM10009773_11960 [Williamsia serinedens]